MGIQHEVGRQDPSQSPSARGKILPPLHGAWIPRFLINSHYIGLQCWLPLPSLLPGYVHATSHPTEMFTILFLFYLFFFKFLPNSHLAGSGTFLHVLLVNLVEHLFSWVWSEEGVAGREFWRFMWNCKTCNACSENWPPNWKICRLSLSKGKLIQPELKPGFLCVCLFVCYCHKGLHLSFLQHEQSLNFAGNGHPGCDTTGVNESLLLIEFGHSRSTALTWLVFPSSRDPVDR